MKRVFAAALFLVVSCESGEPGPPPPDYSAEVNAVADDYLDAALKISPFSVVYAGLGDVVKEDLAAMDDNSPEALANLQRVENQLSERLAKIDAAALSSRADWVLYEMLKESLEASKNQRVCRLNLWGVNHMSGWQNSFPQVADAQPVDTPVERAMALARWRRLPAYLKQEEANLEAGLAAGYSAPKRVVARVVAQLNSILARPPEATPFLSFASKAKGDDAFDAAIKQLATEEIAPAIAAFRDYLRDDYAPRARDDLSIKAVPNGEQCYEALLRTYHTAAIGAKATYERGQAAVAANRAGVIQRGETMFGESDFAVILERTKADPVNRFQSEQELVDFTRAFAPVAREKIAPFFSKLPEQELVVEPFPDFLKGTGQSSRYETKAASDGAATFRINTDEWATQTKGEAEIVLVHEGWPGHHMQIATAYALEGLHPITRLLGSTAYIEGWARYAEGLAEEAGLYESGYGAITRRAWPARGMVMDPGLHLYGWTNDEVKAFAIESGRFDETSAEILLDRLAVIPGQLTAYDTGGLEIAALRAEAVERLGAGFDIHAFHDRVLENGAAPLGALRQNVEKWIVEEEAKAK
jgi:uncharacterized protein (DUF885 family)